MRSTTTHLIDVAGQQQVLAERMLALGALAATSEGADRLRDLADLTETKRAWDTGYQQLVVHGCTTVCSMVAPT